MVYEFHAILLQYNKSVEQKCENLSLVFFLTLLLDLIVSTNSAGSRYWCSFEIHREEESWHGAGGS